MVEYRAGKKEDVQELYDHLEAAMIEYHARDLVPDQRDSVVRKIEVKAE
jgi:molybdopterin biosynthesis enzyme MoaB